MAATMTLDEAIAKAGKLLALAGSDNVHEAAQAAARAQEILDRYEISRAMVDENATEPEEPIQDFADKGASLWSGGKVTVWRRNLASAIAAANQCYTYFYSGRSIEIVGRPSDVDKVRYIYDLVAREIDQLTKKAGAGCGKVWNNNFRLGAVEAIRDTLRTAKRNAAKKIRDEIGSNPAALVKVDTALAKVNERSIAVRQWVNQNMNLKTVRSSYQGDRQARRAGYEAGSNIRISNARGALATGTKQPK